MAIQLLYPGVGEADIIQPGTKTSLTWDFADLLIGDEVVASATVSVVDRAGTVVDDVIGDPEVVDGARAGSAVRVPLTNLIVNNERYKITISATVSADKVLVITIFVPIVEPC